MIESLCWTSKASGAPLPGGNRANWRWSPRGRQWLQSYKWYVGISWNFMNPLRILAHLISMPLSFSCSNDWPDQKSHHFHRPDWCCLWSWNCLNRQICKVAAPKCCAPQESNNLVQLLEGSTSLFWNKVGWWTLRFRQANLVHLANQPRPKRKNNAGWMQS